MSKASSVKSGIELYKPGDTVKYSGEYIVVDVHGNRLDFEIVVLDEGERFPKVNNQNLFYMLSDTCVDEPCEVFSSGEEVNDVNME